MFNCKMYKITSNSISNKLVLTKNQLFINNEMATKHRLCTIFLIQRYSWSVVIIIQHYMYDDLIFDKPTNKWYRNNKNYKNN